jgi:dTDP-4-dehydrorhamnose 3,5-epimerase
MHFIETGLAGAYVVDVEPVVDERGLFARSWCTREFEAHGLNPRLVQCSVSLNHRAGTLRGMHYQVAPHQEAKLVRCTQGALYDVIVDLRPESRTYLAHFGTELTASNHRALYVPEGFAHGYLTLADESEVFYQMSEFYAPSAARGVRWNDPAIAINWPAPVVIMSDRDKNFPDFEPAKERTR